MSRPFTVRFWGVRGSYPVSGRGFSVFGGSTTCLEINIGDTVLIIDAGTGIIPLGNRIAADFFARSSHLLELTVLFTHLHHDHSQGLPFFTPLFLGQSLLHMFGPSNFGQELARVLEYSMTPPNFPLHFHQTSSVKDFHTVMECNRILVDSENPKPALYNRFQDTIPLTDTSILVSIHHDYSHPTDGVLIYKVEYQGKSLVFATDVEGYIYGNNKLIHYAKGADLLIHDAQYSIEEYTALPTPKQGFGHSTPEMAIEVAQKAGAKNLALTHHDPSASDADLEKNELAYRKKMKNLFYAREGSSLTL